MEQLCRKGIRATTNPGVLTYLLSLAKSGEITMKVFWAISHGFEDVNYPVMDRGRVDYLVRAIETHHYTPESIFSEAKEKNYPELLLALEKASLYAETSEASDEEFNMIVKLLARLMVLYFAGKYVSRAKSQGAHNYNNAIMYQ
jgi:hypothetical protein